jgi:hypothetical protein
VLLCGDTCRNSVVWNASRSETTSQNIFNDALLQIRSGIKGESIEGALEDLATPHAVIQSASPLPQPPVLPRILFDACTCFAHVHASAKETVTLGAIIKVMQRLGLVACYYQPALAHAANDKHMLHVCLV